MTITVENSVKYLELFPNDRFFLPREHLIQLIASQYQVSKKELSALRRWIVNLFIRPAFPDSFNRRLDPKIIKKIRNVLTQEAIESLGLYVRLNTAKELPEGEIYKCFVYLVVDEEQLIEKLADVFEKMLTILKALNGIEIIEEESRILSMDDISWCRSRELKKWDFDYISFMYEEEGEVLLVN
jgi:hypothetical protein